MAATTEGGASSSVIVTSYLPYGLDDRYGDPIGQHWSVTTSAFARIDQFTKASPGYSRANASRTFTSNVDASITTPPPDNH